MNAITRSAAMGNADDIWMTLRDRIRRGDFRPNVEIIASPPTPELLQKPVAKMSDPEFQQLAQVRSDWERACAKARKSLRDHQRATENGVEAFKEGLEREYGMTGHPKADLLFDKAWMARHEDGFESVMDWYADMLDLLK